MTKSEFIKAVAEVTGDSKKKIGSIVDAMQTVAFNEMKAEREVKIFDGVSLSGKMAEARTARNPLTGEAVSVPAKVVPKVKFGAPVKTAINA